MKERYRDKWGDIWERFDLEYLRRVRDGNIGGWFHGQGLTRVYFN